MKGNLVTIVKDGTLINIDEDNLCKNDVVVFQAGDIAPADLNIIEANGLEVDEFEITGEIVPVRKDVKTNDARLYMGSRIVRGTGKGVVTATGEQTEFGKVLKQGWEDNKAYEFPLIKMKYLGLVGLLLPAFVLSLALSDADFFVLIFYLLFSVVLIWLQNDKFFKLLLVSTEQKNLERHNIQIRDPRALEDLGEIDLISFDKTGVLTTRQMEVKNICVADKVLDAGESPTNNELLRFVAIVCALCHDVAYYEKIDLANPVDKALITFALQKGVYVKELMSKYRRVYDQPFDAENRFMACGFELINNGLRSFRNQLGKPQNGEELEGIKLLHPTDPDNARINYFAKGAPEAILEMCSHYVTATGTKKKVDLEFFSLNRANMHVIDKNGNAVIALAYASEVSNHRPKTFTFLCLLQLENPLQSGARKIINDLAEKGIRSILLTGDRAKTAARVGAECGISRNARIYLTGQTIDRMDLSEVARQAEYCSIFARLIPSQKGVLIRLLQQKGHSIAMVGDGPNDGIALKVADVGISYVKDSSPIAKRLSKILITELTDLLRLVESAYRIKSRTKQITIFRILILSVSLLSVNLWFLVEIL